MLQPEFAYAYGHLNPESVINTFGRSVYNQLRRQFGPGFFARKGEGVPFDVMAMEFQSQERGGYFNADDVDAYAFMDKVMMPHDEFEARWRIDASGAFYQAAMKRAPDASVSDFARRVSTTEETRKTYFEMSPEQGVLADTSVILPADSIRTATRSIPT